MSLLSVDSPPCLKIMAVVGKYTFHLPSRLSISSASFSQIDLSMFLSFASFSVSTNDIRQVTDLKFDPERNAFSASIW